MDIMDEANECYGYLFVTLLTSVDNLQALQSVVNASHHAEAEAWTHYSYTSWRLTLAVYLSANNVQAVYRCLQVYTGQLIGQKCVFGCCQHWRSDGAQNKSDNVRITEFCRIQTTCLEWSAADFAFIIHHTWWEWTVPEQAKDNTISLDLRDVSWHFRDCLGC